MRAAVRAARRRGAVRVWTVVSHVPASMPRIALLAGTVSRTVSRTLPLPTRGRARTGRRYVAGRAGSVRQIVYTEWTLRRVTPNYCTTRRRRRRGRPRAPRGGASLAGPSSRGLRGAGPRGRRISKCDKSKATCPPPFPRFHGVRTQRPPSPPAHPMQASWGSWRPERSRAHQH